MHIQNIYRIYVYTFNSLCDKFLPVLPHWRLGMSLDSDEEEPQMVQPPRPRCPRGSFVGDMFLAFPLETTEISKKTTKSY